MKHFDRARRLRRRGPAVWTEIGPAAYMADARHQTMQREVSKNGWIACPGISASSKCGAWQGAWRAITPASSSTFSATWTVQIDSLRLRQTSQTRISQLCRPVGDTRGKSGRSRLWGRSDHARRGDPGGRCLLNASCVGFVRPRTSSRSILRASTRSSTSRSGVSPPTTLALKFLIATAHAFRTRSPRRPARNSRSQLGGAIISR